jgi:riboflavin-specific deaminase-like protein
MSRPRVVVNMAPSLDGKISPVKRGGAFVMSRHETDPNRMRELRASADAVVIGGGNLRADDPDLAPSALRVVVSRSGERIPPSARMFDRALGGEAVVAHAAIMTPELRARLGERATLVELGADDVDPTRLLDWLGRERGCRTVVCEGGGGLNASLFAARAVDELRLTIVPRVLGGAGAPGVVSGPGFDPDALPDARLVRVERVGDELFVVYAFDWT